MSESPPKTDCSRIDRREFSRGLAASAGILAWASGAPKTAWAQDQTQEKTSDSPERSSTKDPESAPPPEELLLLTLLVQRYPSPHFDDEALKGIFRDIRGDMARGRILSQFPLKNSDEPGFVFHALPIEP